MFNKKKQYFKKMLKDIEQMIWEKELSKFTLLQEREMVRQQYDKASQALNNVTDRIAAFPQDGKREDKETLKEQKKSIEATIEQMKAEMDVYNTKIDGGPPSEAVPDGSAGVTTELQKWAERREIVKAFIKLNT